MSIKGNFDDITLPDVFQVINIGRKSGKLVVSGINRRAVIIFDEGRIVQANIEGYRKNIGRILLQRNFASKAQINEALHIQSEMDEWKQLGAICLEKGFVTKSQLDEAVKTLISEIVMELLSWQEGTLNFEAGKIDIEDGISLDMREFILRTGISSDSVLLEGARLLDEKTHYEKLTGLAVESVDSEEVELRAQRKKRIKDGWLTSFARGVLEDIDVSFIDMLPLKKVEEDKGERKGLKGAGKIYAEIRMLKDILKRIDEKSLWQEFCFSIMKFASDVVGRVLLFLHKDGNAYGIGHMGITGAGEDIDQTIRKLKIPLDEPSFLKKVFEYKQTYLDKAEETKYNSLILETINASLGREVLVAPIIVNDEVKFLLYADNNPEEEPIKDADSLEAFIYQACMAFEITILERTIKDKENS